MTSVTLAYGRSGLSVDLPDEQTVVVAPCYARAVDDQRLEVLRALQNPVSGPPLRELLRPGAKVAISMCDGTRAQPRHIVIPAVLEALDGIIRLEDVVILVATGTHRGNSAEEIRAMVGDEVANSVTIVNHDARDNESLVYLGRHGNGVPVWLNKIWVEADIHITTGFVEPHFRRLQRGAQDGRTRSRRVGDGPDTAQRRTDRRSPCDLGRLRGQPGA